MKPYDIWSQTVQGLQTHEQHDAFWKDYYAQETEAYKKILGEKRLELDGLIAQLAAELDMELPVFTGFLDGINDSLVEPIDLESLDEESTISAKIDLEKLYYNMLRAKAQWLYTLEQWDDLLTEQQRKDILRRFRQDNIARSEKIGRNDPCPCGSGKKYKKCCGA